MIYPWPLLFLTIFTSDRYISCHPSNMLTTLTLGVLVLCGITLQVSGADPFSTLCILQCDFAFSSKIQASGCDCGVLKGLYCELHSMNNYQYCMYVNATWIIKIVSFSYWNIIYKIFKLKAHIYRIENWYDLIVFKRAMITFFLQSYILFVLNSFKVKTIRDL